MVRSGSVTGDEVEGVLGASEGWGELAPNRGRWGGIKGDAVMVGVIALLSLSGRGHLSGSSLNALNVILMRVKLVSLRAGVALVPLP